MEPDPQMQALLDECVSQARKSLAVRVAHPSTGVNQPGHSRRVMHSSGALAGAEYEGPRAWVSRRATN
jgi:hypothetical protein